MLMRLGYISVGLSPTRTTPFSGYVRVGGHPGSTRN
jgi:hypothetical protein